MKLLTDDLRNVVERSSARETTARVAAGALCRGLLAEAGMAVRSHVVRIGKAALPPSRVVAFEELGDVEASPVRCVDAEAAAAMVAEIDAAKKTGDTVGGVFEVAARGTPPGLGSYSQWDRRLDGRLAQGLMSIHAVKAVSVGAGFEAGETAGSAFHDAILFDDAAGLHRGSNHAGGIEGGVSNAEEIRVRGVVKPIPTLLVPLPSMDVKTKEPAAASIERSDTCVVPAAAVVGEAMVCLVLADALLEKFGGDSIDELRAHLGATQALLREFLSRRR
jgi:chorismate synthase